MLVVPLKIGSNNKKRPAKIYLPVVVMFHGSIIDLKLFMFHLFLSFKDAGVYAFPSCSPAIAHLWNNSD